MQDHEQAELRRAAENGGAAEGFALHYSTTVSHEGDPRAVVEYFERTAFVSSGLAARPDGLGDIYWSLWLVQRLQVRLAETRGHRTASMTPSSYEAFAEGLHAALSAVAHDVMDEPVKAAACREMAVAAALSAASDPNSASPTTATPNYHEEHSDAGQ
ncbi:hypothetical protein AD006_30570 (plasmid) [Pseudonocardia sp. EC080610-09]|uniref:hypothetical protein n=1 Tax=unclassified Pseudonocardia TaxID=2619320 RepID=UPI0007066F13|nr:MULTISPECIES: hypothetical protein [unclassified Pseudonocardia]ALL79555.1 hypothetical protein AD006_30570 [Pseudonocardia sp. EC080610-09]ALL85491.1 hypothetical protein AD017_30670 [Pseudonocardia sp. EC080619-01]